MQQYIFASANAKLGCTECQEYSQQTRRVQPIVPFLAPVFQRPATTNVATRQNLGCEVKANAYIVSGRNAKNGEFPYMVSPPTGKLTGNTLRNAGYNFCWFIKTGWLGLRRIKGQKMGLRRHINQ